MLNLPEKLAKLEKKGQIIKVRIVGAGQMGAMLKTNVKKGDYITWRQIEPEERSVLLSLRRLQDKLVSP
jgi:predicted homoserine dehydrogenase-like protein